MSGESGLAEKIRKVEGNIDGVDDEITEVKAALAGGPKTGYLAVLDPGGLSTRLDKLQEKENKLRDEKNILLRQQEAARAGTAGGPSLSSIERGLGPATGNSFSLGDLTKALEALVAGQQAVIGGQSSLAEQVTTLRDAIAAGQSSSVSISEVNSGCWGAIQAHAHLTLELRDGPPAPHGFRPVPGFGWLDSSEAGQADLYLQFLKNNVRIGSRDLAWLRGDSCRELLTSSSVSGILPHTLRGTCDAAVVTRTAKQLQLYKAGLVAVWEMKRSVSPGHLYQALAQVLTANILSPALRPFGVLTDLNDYWAVTYIDSTLIYVIRPSDRAAAIALIEQLLLDRVDATVYGDGVGDNGAGGGGDQGGGGGGGAGGAEGGDSIGDKAAGGHAPGAKRRRLIQGAAGEGAGGAKNVQQDVANLTDLEGFLPEGECRQAHLQQTLQMRLVRLAELCGGT